MNGLVSSDVIHTIRSELFSLENNFVTPIYMKMCIAYMCWIVSIYVGSHSICIGYMSWRTSVLPNTCKKVLSNTHGVLPKTYTQCIFRVPKTYLGKNQRKPMYVLGNTTYVSPVSIAV